MGQQVGRSGGGVVPKPIGTTALAALIIASLQLFVGAAWASVSSSALAKTQPIHSESWLHPPMVTFSGEDPDPGAGDLFVDAQNAIQAGPMILDPFGQLLWFNPMRKKAAFNVEVQRYHGQSVLTYWQGHFLALGVNQGADVILNHNYQTIATVRGGNGLHPDLHEFQITPRGTALFFADKLVTANLSSLGGPRSAPVLDQVIQEQSIATGKVLWQWDAYRHLPLSETHVRWPISGSYDLFHLNSIQELSNGDLLVSVRHNWAVYDIDKRTGGIVWRVGGKHPSFRMGPGTAFEWQHDAHVNGNILTVFDNGLGPGPQQEHQSRALLIRLNFRTRQATLAGSYTNNPSVLSPNEGSVQRLADGNTFVGFGGAPYFTEFGPHGRQLFSARFPPPMQSYRAYRFPWWGQPLTAPSLAVTSARSGGSKVYASWNGATDVATWQVLAGPAPSLLLPAGQFQRRSFETTTQVTDPGPYFAVRAVGASGQLLATSSTVRLSPHSAG